MEYEKTPIKAMPSKEAVYKQVNNVLEHVPTYRLMWFIVKRHKFGLTMTWAVTVTVLNIVPFLPSMIDEAKRLIDTFAAQRNVAKDAGAYHK